MKTVKYVKAHYIHNPLAERKHLARTPEEYYSRQHLVKLVLIISAL